MRGGNLIVNEKGQALEMAFLILWSFFHQTASFCVSNARRRTARSHRHKEASSVIASG